MLNIKLYNMLIDIIDNAYPDEQYPANKFKKFYIELIPKERKTMNGRYFPDKHTIEVFNLSRPTGHILTTTIHEVSHHIDHCIRNTSDHKKEFYEIMHNMLLAAMGMGIITKDDLVTANDSSNKKNLIKYFGEVENWQYNSIKYKQDLVTFKVINCFSIKDNLKSRGYRYSTEEQAWSKDIDKKLVNEEIEYLKAIINMENVKIIRGNEIKIEAVYYICVLKSYKYKEFLKASGYLWNGYNKIKKNSWTKKVLAKDKELELAKVANLEGVKIQLVSRK